MLRVAHIGLWKEMLIPYIKDRLESGSPEISVNDYLYKWMPEVGWKSATYSYIFGMTYLSHGSHGATYGCEKEQ